MSRRLQRGFTLIEVMVATAVLVTLAAGSLATSWKLVRLARDYVDETAADAYCHDVIYAADASSNRLDRTTSLEWKISPDELPRIVTEGLFGTTKTTYPLWRTKDPDRHPVCRLVYYDADVSNLVVTVKWWNTDGEERTRSAHATVPKLEDAK